MIRKTAEYIRIPKKAAFILVGIVSILVIAFVLRPQVTPVDMGEVKIGLFQKTIVDEGVTAFKVKHTLTAPADGITPTLSLEVGDPVKKGQVLFLFEWDTNFKVRSPIDGFVLRIFEKDRRHVPRGTPLLEVGDPREVEVIAKLLSEEVVDVKLGQNAKITKWGKEEPLEAIISKIEPSAVEEVSALGVKEQRVGVHLDIVTDKSVWKNLGDGFRVEVTVVTHEAPKARLVPVGSLFSNQGHPAVFLIQNKKVELQNVNIGDRNREFAVLKSNLEPGTKLVLYPGSGLKSGDRIQPRF